MKTQEIIKSKAIATIIATLLYYADPSVIWDYASLQQVIVRSLTGSRMVLDIISLITPTARKAKTLETHLGAFADLGNATNNLYQHSNICFLYDNTPTDGGYVYRPSAEVLSYNLITKTDDRITPIQRFSYLGN